MCAQPGCPARVVGAPRCEQHKRQPWAGNANRSAHSRGYGAAWRALRAAVLEAWPTCYLCHEQPSSHVDHVTPRSQGGTDDPANLRGICKRCHASKTGREGARGLRRRTVPEGRVYA